jgi:hypothetical protein
MEISGTLSLKMSASVATKTAHCEPNSPLNLDDWAHAQTDLTKHPIGTL